MRAKETSDDYRYFPEPDLPPLHVEPAWIAAVRADVPELPAARRARYEGLGLTPYDAAVIVADPGMTGAFEAIAAAGPDLPAKEVANFVSGPHAQAAKADGLNATGTAGASTPAGIAALLGAIVEGRVSRPVGRELLARHLADGTLADALLAGAGPGPISDDASLLGHVDAVIAANPRAVDGLPRGQARDRVLRRPGHEGDRRGGGCGARDRARPRAPGRGRLIPMAVLALVLIVVGVVLIVVGVQRAYGPYQRYKALKEQDANVARYEQWRGGLRSDSKTGASVAMEILRRQVQVGGAIVGAGVVAIVIGFILR